MSPLPEIEQPGPKWRKNDGKQPRGTRGKRVRVVLTNGIASVDSIAPGAAAGWAADGKGGCRWTLTGHPFDIAWFLVL